MLAAGDGPAARRGRIGSEPPREGCAVRRDRTSAPPPGVPFAAAGSVGLAHWVLFFGDGLPFWAAVAASAALASVTGFVAGSLRPQGSWGLAAAGCWGAPAWGLVRAAMGSPTDSALLLIPLAAALAASRLGARRPRSRIDGAGPYS